MTKRTVAWIALAIVGVLALAGVLWSAYGPTKIVLTGPQIQERINRALPREFKGLTVDRASVTIAESRIALQVAAHASALGQTLNAVVSARGVPRYEADQGEIFFDPDDVKVDELGLPSGPLAERLGAPLRERAQEVARNVIATGMTAFLAARPVYRFKDDLKGLVVKSGLSDLSMQPDAIVITVSAIALTTWVAVGLVALLVIVALVVALIRNPSWGIGNRNSVPQVSV
jgi:hypothetical protein